MKNYKKYHLQPTILGDKLENYVFEVSDKKHSNGYNVSYKDWAIVISYHVFWIAVGISITVLIF